jgi:excisionase family DNA binding protein
VAGRILGAVWFSRCFENDQMSEPTKNPFDLLLAEIRAAVAEEIAKAVKGSRDDRLLTVEQVCETLNCTEAWLYHNTKKLPFVRKVGGLLRFSSNDLQRWIAAQRLQEAKLKKFGG